MDFTSVEKISQYRYMWMVINNLPKFDTQPSYVFDIIDRMRQLVDHPFSEAFTNIMNVSEKYYKDNGKFPDLAWLKSRFLEVQTIYEYNNPFSMQLYQSLIRYLNIEIAKQLYNKSIAEVIDPTTDSINDLCRALRKIAEKDLAMEESTKDSIINGYENYCKDFNGVKTWIKPVDAVIGVLGHKSLSVLAAPSGHGKSTFAFSLASNVARHGGYVEYLSFEVPKEHVWFNLVSNYSHGKEHPIKASDIKNCRLTEEQKEYYLEHAKNLLAEIGSANGMIHVVDQTSTSGDVNTFEDLCAYLESIAEKRKRKADLIIVDNIDNFQTLKSTSREDEITKINNYIINLDSYCKRYYNNEGTSIFLLSQVNRGGMSRLNSFADASKSKTNKVDVTCLQKYNALYEKATCVLIGFADEGARASNVFRLHVAKLRNMETPTRPLNLCVYYAFSKVMGEEKTQETYKSQEDFDKGARTLFDNDKQRISCNDKDFDSVLDEDD